MQNGSIGKSEVLVGVKRGGFELAETEEVCQAK